MCGDEVKSQIWDKCQHELKKMKRGQGVPIPPNRSKQFLASAHEQQQ